MERNIILLLKLSVFLSIMAISVCSRSYCPSDIASFGKCGYDGFECFDGSCIKRSKYCNNNKDCSDNSDENYCGDYYSSCPGLPRDFVKCRDSSKCIPRIWICDGIADCPNKVDEKNCSMLLKPKLRSIEWLKNTTVSSSPTRKWGYLAPKTAVAFYLSNPLFLTDNSSEREQITYELSIQLLSQINQKKIQGVSSSDLASFINAFLVTCIDPREFYGYNLINELRYRVAKQNYTLPYVFLALCNAGDTITESDVKKLTDIFWSNRREIWTDTQAMVLMALSCARNQTDSTVDDDLITELSLELKQRQYRNGTVENLYNTLLVMQALYAAEPNVDANNFDEAKAVSYILQNQAADGSFGNLALTYYALPVLNCKSLVNISSSHCKAVEKDEETAIFDLINHNGRKVRVRYSLWFGMKRDIEKTLSLLVPEKTSFYRIMELAAEIDNKYKFEYIMKNRKPYITAVSGVMDDSETEQYWFLYTVKDGNRTFLEQSTAEIFPKNDDHMVMWYRRGSWVE